MITLFRVKNYKHLFYNLLPVIVLLLNVICEIKVQVTLTDILQRMQGACFYLFDYM